jgi:hypothetical protein
MRPCLHHFKAVICVLGNTGDLVWWGNRGDKPSDNPYWKLVNESLVISDNIIR